MTQDGSEVELIKGGSVEGKEEKPKATKKATKEASAE